MAKQKFTLTNSNPTEAISGVDSGKAVSLRYAFALGKLGQGRSTQVTFRPTSQNSGSFFTSIPVYQNYQNQIDGDMFNYPLYEGQEIIVEAQSLQAGESIYVEVEYEILDI